MRSDSSFQSHGMAHQTADTAIAVGKGMNVIQSMMCSGHGDHARTFAFSSKAVLLGEILHEGHHTPAIRWYVAADSYFMLWQATEFSGFHPELAARSLHEKHGFRCALIKLAMQPANECDRGRLR